MKSFSSRLKSVARAGNLTIADLARWLDRPHATVRSWLNGREPGGGPKDAEHAEAMLATLEQLVARKTGFPVPRMSPQERKKYVASVRKAVVG